MADVRRASTYVATKDVSKITLTLTALSSRRPKAMNDYQQVHLLHKNSMKMLPRRIPLTTALPLLRNRRLNSLKMRLQLLGRIHLRYLAPLAVPEA